jgi:hypothetical protein
MTSSELMGQIKLGLPSVEDSRGGQKLSKSLHILEQVNN